MSGERQSDRIKSSFTSSKNISTAAFKTKQKYKIKTNTESRRIKDPHTRNHQGWDPDKESQTVHLREISLTSGKVA